MVYITCDTRDVWAALMTRPKQYCLQLHTPWYHMNIVDFIFSHIKAYLLFATICYSQLRELWFIMYMYLLRHHCQCSPEPVLEESAPLPYC